MIRNMKIMGLLLVLTGLVSSAHGLERFEIITTQELQQMLTERAAGNQDFVLVNTLDSLIYEHQSIPGSINIPWSRAAGLADRLGSDRNRLVVTYCMGYR
jgi:3-mercaptopyruvate sulfurtransferase SseA